MIERAVSLRHEPILTRLPEREAAGDELLERVGAALSSILREGDIAARIGGDEFVVFLVGSSADAAKEVAARIVAMVAALSQRYPDAPVGASGDAVMYAATNAGRGRVAAEVV